MDSARSAEAGSTLGGYFFEQNLLLPCPTPFPLSYSSFLFILETSLPNEKRCLLAHLRVLPYQGVQELSVGEELRLGPNAQN